MREELFEDRVDAGRRLGEAVARRGYREPIVLGLPRGGVPVAAEVARRLKAPLDVLLVRKIGAPGQQELAIGAVVDGAEPVVIMNDEVAGQLGIEADYVEREKRRLLEVIERRRKLYLGERPAPRLEGCTVIIVDDGIATGATVRVAIAAVRRQRAARIVVAAPLAARETLRVIEREADEVVCLETPRPFQAVGYHYADFRQVTDAEVTELLHRFQARDEDCDDHCAPGQKAVLAALGNPATYGSGVARVERIETHGNVVFLAGDSVYKVKKALRFSYMDFSTLALRRAACVREIEVNQPCAPDLYLGVVPIIRTPDGQIAIGAGGQGEEEPIEWAVHMRRFPDDALLSRVAEAGGVSADLARQIADAVLEYHQAAPVVAVREPLERFSKVVDGVTSGLQALPRALPAAHVARLDEALRAGLHRARAVIERRAAEGFVRRCHGDLHLGNIVLWGGRPTLFDAIEFDESIATTDTLYDLAFLLMDLDERGQRAAANIVLNRYLWRSRAPLDLEGLAALPAFMALRAAIRAMVLAQRAAQQDPARAEGSTGESRRYLDEALRLVEPRAARIIAIGGLSGTGKSTAAAALAPMIGAAPGAVHLRSDLERKAMFGVAETQRLPAETYTPEASRRVYELLEQRTRLVSGAGHAVVVDAVFAKLGERRAMEAIAEAAGIAFHGIWLTAPAETLLARVGARRGDASDATVQVVSAQLGWEAGPGCWVQVDAAGSPADTLAAIVSAVGAG